MIDNREKAAPPSPLIVDAPRELTPAQVRLECLRLCQRHDLAPADIIKRAREYEAYALEAIAAAYSEAATPEPANERSRSRRRGSA